MSIAFDLPDPVEQQLALRYGDLSAAAKEAMLLEMYRREELSHRQLADCLGLDRAATDALLKRRGVLGQTPTLVDLEMDGDTVEQVLGPAG